jgi:valyl-tRNA synthetase
MVMAGYEFMGEAPFTDVFLHGTVRDAKGRKMSKSLGNGIDPLEVVDRFGADALRWTVLSMCGVGTDIHLDHEDLEAAFAPGRNFANKLWNAGRFTLMSVGEGAVKPLAEVEADLEATDRWILSRFHRATASMTDGLERFRLHDVVERAHRFFWGDFADWYLEVVKTRLRGEEGEASREAARAVLSTSSTGRSVSSTPWSPSSPSTCGTGSLAGGPPPVRRPSRWPRGRRRIRPGSGWTSRPPSPRSRSS